MEAADTPLKLRGVNENAFDHYPIGDHLSYLFPFSFSSSFLESSLPPTLK